MDDTEPDVPDQDGAWLRERAPADHLESDESLRYVLTNRAVGVHREGDEETVQLPPGDDHGALALVTDRRTLLLVGHCPERDGDVAMPIPHEVVTDATAETETLTERLVVETESDVAWAFTARETGETATVADFVAGASEAWRAVEANLESVVDARDRLERGLEDGDWEACDDAIADARDGLDPIQDALADVEISSIAEQVDPLAAEVDDLAAARHRREADALADEAEARFSEYEHEAGHDRLQAATEHVERATALVEDAGEAVTAADGGTTVAATADRIDDLREDLATRPLDDATAHRQRAEETGDRAERIEALEDALTCYRNAAALIATRDSPFEGDEATAHEDAVAVIDDLLDALFAAGAQARSGAEWERDADNPRSAYELFEDARAHYERALDLAESYPPGDADAIEAELSEIQDAIDPLEIKINLEAQNADGDADAE